MNLRFPPPSKESFLHTEAVRYLNLKHPNLVFWHTPNGEARNVLSAVKLKRMGVLAGVPDLFFPSLKLFIELKGPKGRLSKSQEKLREKLISFGYDYAVIDDFKLFMNLIESKTQC